MFAALLERGQDGVRCLGIAERDSDVAQPAFVTDAAYRTAFGARHKVAFTPAKEVREFGVVETVPGREIGLCRLPCKLVPWTKQLAVVTTVNPVADIGPERFRDRAAKFDGQVRDTASGIELVRRDNRVGGANVDACPAAAAVIARGRIDRQWQIRIQLA